MVMHPEELKLKKVDDCRNFIPREKWCLPKSGGIPADREPTKEEKELVPFCEEFNRKNPNCTNACPLYKP